MSGGDRSYWLLSQCDPHPRLQTAHGKLALHSSLTMESERKSNGCECGRTFGESKGLAVHRNNCRISKAILAEAAQKLYEMDKAEKKLRKLRKKEAKEERLRKRQKTAPATDVPLEEVGNIERKTDSQLRQPAGGNLPVGDQAFASHQERGGSQPPSPVAGGEEPLSSSVPNEPADDLSRWGDLNYGDFEPTVRSQEQYYCQRKL